MAVLLFVVFLERLKGDARDAGGCVLSDPFEKGERVWKGMRGMRSLFEKSSAKTLLKIIIYCRGTIGILAIVY